MQEISEESWRGCIDFLYEIYSGLRHFSIQKSHLVVGYNATICDDEDIELIIDPVDEYELCAHHNYSQYSNQEENSMYSGEFSYNINPTTQKEENDNKNWCLNESYPVFSDNQMELLVWFESDTYAGSYLIIYGFFVRHMIFGGVILGALA